ncbi:MAG: hypothetical protein LBU11_06090 [Zoogloeaceae bacterium]|nr:hypothetical protein [Zoogloeaceae bacterium]
MIVAWLQEERGVTRVARETTGGYETSLTAGLPAARRDIREHIAWLDARIAHFERELDMRLRKSEARKEKVELLEAAPGVGKVTIFTLLARLPEPGQRNRGQIAARVGWLGGRPSTATAASGADSDTSGAGAARCAARCT